MTNDLKKYRDLFEHYLANYPWENEPKTLYDPLKYIINLGGKRIRPLLTLLVCDLFSSNYKRALDSAMAIELFHNFSLIHDDIMDDADKRRGATTVHQKYNTNQAILSGDVMLIKAYEMLSQVNDPLLQYRLYRIFNKTAKDVCEGQQFDIDFETNLFVTEEMYLDMIGKKTASLIATAIQIGAVIGGLSDEQSNLLYTFGFRLGKAFQIQDDWLDVFGDPGSFGKMDSGDILQNKKTILFIVGRDRANEQDRLELLSWYSSEEYSQNKISRVKEIFDKYEVQQIVNEMMMTLYDDAIVLLDQINLNKHQYDVMAEIAQLIVKRTS